MAPSAAAEDGLALLHEGAAAFDVVLAVEAAPHQRLAAGAVDLGGGLGQLGDDALDGREAERRVLGDHRAIGAHECLELGHRAARG